VNVRNVAQTVIHQAYAIYGFEVAAGRRERATAGAQGSHDAAPSAPTSER
jgi:hypothetical protein